MRRPTFDRVRYRNRCAQLVAEIGRCPKQGNAHGNYRELFSRALLHGASGWSSELVLDVDQRRQRCYHQLGRLAEAHLAIALEYVKQGEAVSAEMYLERAAGQARQDGQPDVQAEVHFARWRLIGDSVRHKPLLQIEAAERCERRKLVDGLP